MPQSIKEIFNEARIVSFVSSRAAAGLLRLCIEKLTEELGEEDGSLNKRISNLEKQGLHRDIQKALHAVRLTGNNALHSGQIGFDDNADMTQSLFNIVNIIVQRTISDQKQIQTVYENLPKDQLKNIEKKDKKVEQPDRES